MLPNTNVSAVQACHQDGVLGGKGNQYHGTTMPICGNDLATFCPPPTLRKTLR